jgi:hypothetical protein
MTAPFATAGPGDERSRGGDVSGRAIPGRELVLAAALALLAQLLVSLPSLLGEADVLVRHFDGPSYLVIAKTFYRPTTVNPLPGYISTPLYFAGHLPFYPVFVRAAAVFAGYPAGLLLATAAFGAASAAVWAAYQRVAAPAVAPLLGVLLFLFVPPRHLLYRSIGATEAPMALLVVLAALAYRRGRYGWAFAAAGLASVTRINGILVVGVLAIALLARRRVRTAVLGSALAAFPILVTAVWYGRVFGNPAAFFRVHGSQRGFAPFGYVLDLAREGRWVDAELVLSVFLFYGVAAARLWTAGDRFESGLVLAHLGLFCVLRETDLPRFALTVAPFAVVLAFRDVWEKRRVAAAFLAASIPLSLAYAWATMPNNVCHPVAYAALLRFLKS